MNDLTPHDRSALECIVTQLTQAWNAADGERFASVFAADGDQVNIMGEQLIGRDEIRERHAKIFKTVFRESTNVLKILSARYAAANVIVARISSTVTIPHGNLQGELQTMGSLVLRSTGSSWEIILFHNTRVAPD
jgi:uncharacterized protein (TIGR02246 family)